MAAVCVCVCVCVCVISVALHWRRWPYANDVAGLRPPRCQAAVNWPFESGRPLIGRPVAAMRVLR